MGSSFELDPEFQRGHVFSFHKKNASPLRRRVGGRFLKGFSRDACS